MIDLSFDPEKAKPPARLVEIAENCLPANLDPATLVQIVPFDPSWPDGETWSLRLKVPGPRTQDLLQMTATWYSQEDTIDLVWMNVDPAIRKQGLGTRALANLVNCADALGVNKITLAATTDGALAWLRFGFAPNDDEWHDDADDGMRQKLLNRFDAQQDQLAVWAKQGPAQQQIVQKLGLMYEKWQDENVAGSAGDPSDIRILNSLGHDPHGQKIAQAVMKGISWNGHLGLTPQALGRQCLDQYLAQKLSVPVPTATIKPQAQPAMVSARRL